MSNLTPEDKGSRIYFLRHAESGNNAGQKRSPDPDLTERGHEQARAAAEYMIHIDSIIKTYIKSEVDRKRKLQENLVNTDQNQKFVTESVQISKSKSLRAASGPFLNLNRYDIHVLYISPMTRTL